MIKHLAPRHVIPAEPGVVMLEGFYDGNYPDIVRTPGGIVLQFGMTRYVEGSDTEKTPEQLWEKLSQQYPSRVGIIVARDDAGLAEFLKEFRDDEQFSLIGVVSDPPENILMIWLCYQSRRPGE